MKKSILILITLSTLFYSCSKDDSATTEENVEILIPPKVTQVSGNTQPLHGVVGAPTFGALLATVKGDAEEGFISLEIFKIINGQITSYEILEEGSPGYVVGSNSQTYELHYPFTSEDAGKEIYFRAVITDSKNATESLDFAFATVKNPMTNKTLVMSTPVPVDSENLDAYYFLHIENNEILGKTMEDTQTTVGIDEKIAFVYSVNEGSGFYLASPDRLLETDLLENFDVLNTTKFKELDMTEEEFSTINLYDVFDVEDSFASAAYNSDEGRAEQVSTVDKVFAFQTIDLRTGLIKVNSFSINNNFSFLTITIWLTE